MLAIGLKTRRSRLAGLLFFLTTVLAGAIWAASPDSLQIDSNGILNHLNLAISWYRHLSSADETSGQPSDVLYLQNARDLAHQALQYAFESAQAEASLRLSPAGGPNPASDTELSSDQQGVAKALASTSDRITQI